MKMTLGIVFMLTIGAALFFCQPDNTTGKRLDTPTSGHIIIQADEAYRPLVDAEVEVFHALYKNAHVEVRYGSEKEAQEALSNDSIALVLLTRHLTKEEEAYFKSRQFSPKRVEVAKDALALIVHPDNPVSTFTVDQVKDILSGKITTWEGSTDKIQLVFDHPHSGVIRFAVDSLCPDGKLSPNASALKLSKLVIEYVAANPNALGIIGNSWISDMDDPQSQQFLKQVKVAGVRKTARSEAFLPYQAYLATKDYPFIRTLTVYNTQARPGLGQGFSAFLASERGQKIVQKSGMLPATMPVRLVQVSN